MTAAEIEAAVAKTGLDPLGPDLADSFQSYLELLLKWNARLNLTAIREPEEILQRHFIECIFAARHLPSGIRTLLDFGSGGGFPGLPIALCRPEIEVSLGESQAKKAAFLREVVRLLGIANATVYTGRVEDLDRAFDAVALRAVDKMLDACRTAVHKVAPGGYLVLFLGEEASSAIVSEFDQFTWDTPVLLPESTQRLLLIGRKSA
jgi:16S rRNA (guanine527-N7)-methyltransferase